MNRSFLRTLRPAALLLFALLLCTVYSSYVLAIETSPDEGLVIFHRADKLKAKSVRFNIEQDGRPIGQLLAGTTLEVPLAPGSYTFTARAPSLDGMDYLTLNVEAGKTYNVEGEVLWGWPVGRPKFHDVSEFGVANQQAKNPAASATSGTAEAAGVPDVPPDMTRSGSTLGADEKGRLGLKSFTGDWDLEIWSLASDGSKVTGSGIARGSAEGDSATRIVISEFESVEFPEATGGGHVMISYLPGMGFALETDFRYSDEVLRLTGGYQMDSGTYVFYLIGGANGQIATGIDRVSVRLEIRSLDVNTWEAATFAHVDGHSTQVQLSRFVRR